MANPTTKATISVGEASFNALSVQSGITTVHDHQGMPLMGSVASTFSVTADAYDTENLSFQTLQQLFTLANLVTRDKVKDIKSPTRTYVVNHTGEKATRTITYKDVDKAALMTYLKRGTPTGRWVLGVNDCNTWAEGAIHESTPHDIYSRAIVTRNGIVGGAPKLLHKHVVVYADGSIQQR